MGGARGTRVVCWRRGGGGRVGWRGALSLPAPHTHRQPHTPCPPPSAANSGTQARAPGVVTRASTQLPACASFGPSSIRRGTPFSSLHVCEEVCGCVWVCVGVGGGGGRGVVGGPPATPPPPPHTHMHAHTLPTRAQSRGRARMRNSEMVLMVEQGSAEESQARMCMGGVARGPSTPPSLQSPPPHIHHHHTHTCSWWLGCASTRGSCGGRRC